MTLDDTLELLAQVALVDDRVVKVDEAEQRAQVTMWAAVLRDVPLSFAGQAVGDHYAESAWPVKPSDITARWRAVVRDRLGRSTGTFEPTDHPYLDPDAETGDAYVAALRAERRRIAGGETEPVGLRELMPAVGSRLGGGRLAELVPANNEFREAKAQRFPRREQPAGPVERAVHCPACGAHPGKPCRSLERGRVLSTCHGSRRDAYLGQHADDRQEMTS